MSAVNRTTPPWINRISVTGAGSSSTTLQIPLAFLPSSSSPSIRVLRGIHTSKSPVESIRASGRYDFIVEHDVKELGAHTLVCTALYSDGDGERKYLPQFFKFMVSNPLSVRTEVRVVKENTFLEACIENNTKSNLYMDQVEFEPAQNWTATVLKADGHLPEHNLLTRELFKEPILIRAGGGIYNHLYQLRLSSQDSLRVKLEGSNVLGKLQITWRTNLMNLVAFRLKIFLETPSYTRRLNCRPLRCLP